jgi:hypothetical protein
MKIYNVIFKREVTTDIDFEVEADTEDEAREIAQEEFDNLDWSYMQENDRFWNIEKVEDLGDIDESEDEQ